MREGVARTTRRQIPRPLMMRYLDVWIEIRTAACVARHGQVSSAARELGMHRKTVHRHIETVEEWLGVKLFIRSAKGYAPTNLCKELLAVIDDTFETITAIQRRAKQSVPELRGELVLTSVDSVASELLSYLPEFRKNYPNLAVRIIGTNSFLDLARGEADVAIRMGERPTHPDYVVVPWVTYRMGLFASKDYVERNGRPKSREEYPEHRFVVACHGPEKSYTKWMMEEVPPSSIALKAETPIVERDAILNGNGIGFVPKRVASTYNLIEVIPYQSDWVLDSWFVTHVDVHRDPRVQALRSYLKEIAERTQVN